MKRFIVLMIFAIGMFAMLPSTSSGSAPPGQSSFIADQSVDLTAMVPDGFSIAETRYSASVQECVSITSTLICRKGGDVVILEAIFADQRHLNLCDKTVSPKVNFTQDVVIEFRYSSLSQLRNQNIQRNNVSVHPVRIRADTQDV